MWTVRATLMVVVAAALALFSLSRDAAVGLLMGGIAGALAFWYTAHRAEQLAATAPDKLRSHLLVTPLLRYALYGLVLWRAHVLDPATHHGLLAAVAGLFATHVAAGVYAFAVEDEVGQER